MGDAATDTAIVKTPMQYLDKAMGACATSGWSGARRPRTTPITALLEQISDLEPDKIAVIARTLGQASVFNEVVREQIAAMNIGERYEDITKPSTRSATTPRRWSTRSRTARSTSSSG